MDKALEVVEALDRCQLGGSGPQGRMIRVKRARRGELLRDVRSLQMFGVPRNDYSLTRLEHKDTLPIRLRLQLQGTFARVLSEALSLLHRPSWFSHRARSRTSCCLLRQGIYSECTSLSYMILLPT